MATRLPLRRWNSHIMDLLKLQRDRIRAQPPLASCLRHKRQRWLKSYGARHVGRGWTSLDAAMRFAVQRAARWTGFPVLLQGEWSFPWRALSMEYLLPGERSSPMIGKPSEKRPAATSASSTF